MGMMILKGGRVGRGWSQFCLINQSSLENRKSRSLGVSSLSVSVPQCGGCVPVCWSVPQCKGVCPSVGQCVPVCEGVSLCVRVSQYGCVCRSMGGCVPVRVCSSIGGWVGCACVCACVFATCAHGG